MKKALARNFFSLFLLLPLGAIAAPTDDPSPQEVISRLVTNASKTPPGPVENDVTAQTLQTLDAMAKDPKFKDMMGSVRESISAEYNQFSLEGPVTSLYSEGSAALFYAKVKLTTDGVADHKEDGASPGFGESGGFCFWVGPQVRDDGHVMATFCLIQQNGLWKVHGVYLSNDVIAGSNKTFIVNQLSAFAKKN